MKIAVFNDHRVGVVEDLQLYDVTAAFPEFLQDLPQQRINWLISHWGNMQGALLAARSAAAAKPLAGVTLLAATWPRWAGRVGVKMRAMGPVMDIDGPHQVVEMDFTPALH